MCLWGKPPRAGGCPAAGRGVAAWGDPVGDQPRGAVPGVTPQVTTWPRADRGARAGERPRGRSQVQLWSATLGSPPPPAFFLLFFPFPPVLGRPFPSEELVDTHILRGTRRGAHRPFFPPSRRLRISAPGLVWALTAWTSSGKPISTLCAMDGSGLGLCCTFLALCWQYTAAHTRRLKNPLALFYRLALDQK